MRYWRMSLAIVVGLIVLSAAVTWGSTSQVQARATIGLSAPRANSVVFNGVQGDASLARYTTQRARFVTSDAVIDAVAADVGRDDVTTLRKDIIAAASANSNVITVLVDAEDSERAVALAQSVVDAYRAQTHQQIDELTDAAIASLTQSAAEIRQEVDVEEGSAAVAATAANIIGQLQIQAADLETSRALTGDGVEFVIAPRSDSVIESGPPLRELALGLLVGLAIAASLAWVRADRNRQISGTTSAAELLDASCLGEIQRQPEHVPLPPETISRLPTHDHRVLWSALVHRVPRGAIVVTSVGTDAPAWTAVNLAAAAARDGHDVLVVDADMQTAQMLGRERGATGIAQLLTTGASWSDHVVTIGEFSRNHFSVLPAGPDVDENDPRTSLASGFVEEWCQRYDYVMITARSIRDDVVATLLAEGAGRLFVSVGHQAEERDLAGLRRHASQQNVTIVGFALIDAERTLNTAPTPQLFTMRPATEPTSAPTPAPESVPEPLHVVSPSRVSTPTPPMQPTRSGSRTSPAHKPRPSAPVSLSRVSTPTPPPPPMQPTRSGSRTSPAHKPRPSAPVSPSRVSTPTPPPPPPQRRRN
ncbi:MAG: succinoglycan biosynthesis transport protein ExoP [Candidatus Azotimanducaceae bacterium]|jgi:succinoglycan biosynthesis transport protein ExoP